LHPIVRRMKRFYTIALYAVTIATIAATAIQTHFALENRKVEASKRGEAVVSAAESQISRYLEAGNFQAVEFVINDITKRNEGFQLSACVIRNGRIVKTVSSSEKKKTFQICETAKATYLSGVSEKDTVVISGVNYLLNIRTMKASGTNISNQYLTIASQEMSVINSSWPEFFLKTFALTWFVGVVGLLFIILPLARRSDNTKENSLEKDEETSDDPPSFLRELSPPPFLRRTIGGRSIIVVANREPYIHQRKSDRIEIIRPASGLVTALEPVLRQCGGLWIAHGSGSADNETVNEMSEIAVPPDNPSYTLKRVWMTPEEELGYYYGFSNEGLWPLCHLAHTRPIFRLPDWDKYQQINRRFAEAVPRKGLNTRNLILVQDYHFALLPRMLKERAAWQEGLPAPRVGLFWHIPWPNPEAFGICPWNKDLLRGMLGADVIGFHTQYHCNNFLETCDRYLEARIDWESFSVTMERNESLVRSFPIGIDTTPVPALNSSQIESLKSKYKIKAEFVAVGVDRLDYTKGILERVDAVGRFLDKYPEYIGRFSLVQVGSPSRTHIPAYQYLNQQINSLVTEINERFTSRNNVPEGYLPIVLVPQHHEWDQIKDFYQLGDVCMVTSLHDGMNLVAKEYVWCQTPERGALILSKFTGASKELTEAFVINPYSIEEMADAIARALNLPAKEKARRMKAMRAKVASHNAFHWASNLISTLTKVKSAA